MVRKPPQCVLALLLGVERHDDDGETSSGRALSVTGWHDVCFLHLVFFYGVFYLSVFCSGWNYALITGCLGGRSSRRIGSKERTGIMGMVAVIMVRRRR